MLYINKKLLNLGDATQATVTSNALDVVHVVNASVVAVAVGTTITGTLKVQVSNDPMDFTQGPTNWVDTSNTVSITGAGNFLIPKFDCSYMWMRLVYTKTTSAAGAKISAFVKTNGI